MNKEQLKKEFYLWIEQGRPKRWYRNIDEKNWDITDSEIWTDNVIYIIDNEFSELRKAFYDGKQIEAKVGDGETWALWTLNNEPNWEGWAKDSFRIVDETIIYEWQYYTKDASGRYRLSDFYTDNEIGICPSYWIKFEPSKRIRP